MYKGFHDTSKGSEFKGFPNLNFQMNNSAYGFSGLIFWLDAAFGLNTQVNGAGVSSWKEITRGLNFTQPTVASQPLYRSSEATMNNLPCVDFVDSGKFMTGSDFIGVSNFTTIAFVIKVNSILSAGSRNLFLANGSGGRNIYLGGGDAAIDGIGIYDVNVTVIKSAIEDTLPHIVVIKFGSGDAEIVIDGVSRVTGTCLGLTNPKDIGTGNSANTLVAKVAEILFYNQKLSSADCIRLCNNLNAKYAIY